MFDEFMKELRRRQAEAAGERPPPDVDDTDAVNREEDPAADAEGNSAPRDDGPEPTPIRGRGRRGRSSPPPPREPGFTRARASGGRPSRRRRLGLGAAIFVVVFVAIMFVVGIDFWTDAIWYRSVGFDSVFWTRVGVQAGLFAVGAIVALALLVGSIWLAGRLAAAGAGSSGGADGGRAGRQIPRPRSAFQEFIDRLTEAAREAGEARGRGPWDPSSGGRRPPGPPIDVTPLELPDPVPIGRTIIVGFAVLVALGVGGSVAGNWDTIQLWLHRVPFAPSGAAVTDPIFGRDISFFLFDLPFLRFIQSEVVGLLVVLVLVTAARYLLAGMASGGLSLDTPVRVHIGVLAGLLLFAIALGYQLDKFELVYSNRGVATGVSFTDANAQFLAYDVLTVVSAVAAALLVGGAFARVLWPLGLTLVVWFAASLVIGRLYPAAVQYFTVNPNTLAQERQYIGNNIAMTRLSYDLGGWIDRPYRGEAPLTQAAIAADDDTFRNARLWDYRPLRDTLDQIQTVRQYYDFVDVDTDRYQFGGDLRQVMLSGRELAIEKNPDATGWVNQRVTYTHGFGLAMVPVNEVGSQGQPRLVISNLPPISAEGAPTLSEPRIYFGERNADYVVVGARQNEFDYQAGSADAGQIVATRWSGTTGVRLDGLNRLLFAARFGDLNLLISDQVTAESQLLFHRSLGDRLPRIAPFLRYDKDPYLVVDGQGRLKFIQDAYTVADRFPNAQGFDADGVLPGTGLGGSPFNYIRNSVKIVSDAYDGSMVFYVADPDDPLIRAWQGVFPSLFHPIAELPADLKPHLRVPEELFNVQTRVFGRYHVTDAPTFYGQNDVWTVPIGQSNEQSLPSEAYYVVMRLPGADAAEFLLLQPMIPQQRPNMIAWVATRMDGEHYGETQVFRFPTDTSVYGPAQVEAQIDADPEISAQITLWDQAGSQVVRGNLIVVPVGESLVYLQPVYLKSRSAAFPAFERIVVASPTNVVWGSTLKEALDRLLAEQGAGPSPTPTPSPTPGPSGSPGSSPTPSPSATPGGLPSDVAGLIAFANAHFDLAQAALRDGDFARYGSEIGLVQAALSQLQALAGPGASGSPSTAP
jgi:uncharacterized membrane protein (UPF0182 family)